MIVNGQENRNIVIDLTCSEAEECEGDEGDQDTVMAHYKSLGISRAEIAEAYLDDEGEEDGGEGAEEYQGDEEEADGEHPNPNKAALEEDQNSVPNPFEGHSLFSGAPAAYPLDENLAGNSEFQENNLVSPAEQTSGLFTTHFCCPFFQYPLRNTLFFIC